MYLYALVVTFKLCTPVQKPEFKDPKMEWVVKNKDTKWLYWWLYEYKTCSCVLFVFILLKHILGHDKSICLYNTVKFFRKWSTDRPIRFFRPIESGSLELFPKHWRINLFRIPYIQSLFLKSSCFLLVYRFRLPVNLMGSYLWFNCDLSFLFSF